MHAVGHHLWARRGRGRSPLLQFLVAAIALACVFAAPAVAAGDQVTVIAVPVSATEGQSMSREVARFVDSPGDDSASDYSATIDWGDGSSSAGTVTGSGGGSWQVTASHTYAEEGYFVETVTVHDAASAIVGSDQQAITVADAPLSVPVGTPTQFTGAAGAAGPALSSLAAGIGGANNGAVPTEQPNGFRQITWDDMPLDGTFPGSHVIVSGHVVAIPPNAELPYGVSMSRGAAVANDGFASVNSGVGSSLSPFSAPNDFAPIATPTIRMQVVAPAGQGETASPQATRGFGVMFVNVREPNTTTIQYYNGNSLLYTVAAPVGGQGQPSFVGALFSSPVITSVVINLGTAAIFSFDGTSASPGPSDSPPQNNLVAADNVLLAEPSTVSSNLTAPAGVTISGAVDTFSDTDSSAVASDYAAQVDWGDGSTSIGHIVAGANGFVVAGQHAYSHAGRFSVLTTVTDLGGSTETGRMTITVTPRATTTRLTCSPRRLTVSIPETCTATVTDTVAQAPMPPAGLVSFTSRAAGIGFADDGGCHLVQRTAGVSSCRAVVTANIFPKHERSASISAVYGGDPAHTPSRDERRFRVLPATCALRSITRNLSRGTGRLLVRVTCAQVFRVEFFVTAIVTRRGALRGERLAFKHPHQVVGPGAPVSVTISPTKRVFKALLAAERNHQRITLWVTMVAVPKSKPIRVTTTVRRVRVS